MLFLHRLKAYIITNYHRYEAWRSKRYMDSVLRGLKVERTWPQAHWVRSSKGWD